MTDLDKLIGAVEASDDEGVKDYTKYLARLARDLDTHSPSHDVAKAYRGSLDAAKVLHEVLLPEFYPGLSQNIHYGYWYAWVENGNHCKFDATEKIPARAWLLAILKAYRSQVTRD